MESVLVYFDDVLVCSRSLEEHLTKVFGRLRRANLCLKPKECMFLCPRVQYLGYVISQEGVSPDPEKVEKVKHYSQTEVRQFLRLALL